MNNNLEALVSGVINGERVALARAITLVESTLESDSDLAETLLLRLSKSNTNKALVIGISGMPGVGKSTFIEKIGMHYLSKQKRVAVLAIDPTSPISGGSILGDKTRMELLSREENCFIRPSPSGTQSGGVARHTHDAIRLCEAAGYQIILIESVGVGQAEYSLASMTDYFLLLQLPGSGDDLQGIKKGILELADMVVIQKADGAMLQLAKSAQVEHERALHLVRTTPVPVMLCSAATGQGINEIADTIESCITVNSSQYTKRRREQSLSLFKQETLFQLQDWLSLHKETFKTYKELEQNVIDRAIPERLAAKQLIQALLSK